ncbi:MAG: DUF2796 domain-containing protein [Pseudomonadota bacterium]
MTQDNMFAIRAVAFGLAMGLAACGNAVSDAEIVDAAEEVAPAPAPEADTPAEVAAMPDTAAAPVPAEAPTEAEADAELVQLAAAAADEDGHSHGDDHHDHGDDAHDHGEAHGDGDDHDHGSHDHEDHGHSAEAHVHGEAEGALVLEGNALTISLDSALASFGLQETEPANDEEAAARQAVFDALGEEGRAFSINAEAGCSLSSSSQSVRMVGEVGNAVLEYAFVCTDPGALETIAFTLFEDYPALEEINLAVLIEDRQEGATLTPGAASVSIDQG